MNYRSLKTTKASEQTSQNVTHCFILNRKEVPIHYSTIADVFHDVFCDIYLRSSKILHFRRGHVVIEAFSNVHLINT